MTKTSQMKLDINGFKFCVCLPSNYFKMSESARIDWGQWKVNELKQTIATRNLSWGQSIPDYTQIICKNTLCNF